MKGVPAEKIDSYLKDLLNKCKKIQPEYMPITEVVDYKGKKFIVVWAPGGLIRPYSSPKTMAKEDKERVYWIRKMASTIAPTITGNEDAITVSSFPDFSFIRLYSIPMSFLRLLRVSSSRPSILRTLV